METSPLEIFNYMLQLVSVGALVKITLNTGRLIEKIDLFDKILADHEIRLRKIEDKESRLKLIERFVKEQADINKNIKI